MFRIIQHIIFLCVITAFNAEAADFRYIQYDGFHLTVDCEKKSAIRFTYTIGPDTANLKRRTSFSKDPNFPTECQQFSGNPYSGSPEPFDRGHLVPANHLDNLELGIHQSNYVTNILPQAAKMNRGAWLRTEEIIECHRENGLLLVYGGTIYDSDISRDFFTESHGIKTPSAFWKVIINKTSHIAWIVPNTSVATRSKLDKYLVSIDQIEKVTGEYFQTINKDEKAIPATTSWELLPDCDLS